MSTLLSDLRHAARSLLARRSFTLTAVLTLALGIGMTTAIFGVLHGVVLRPLPLPHAGRLITLCEQHPGATPDWCSIAAPNVADIADRAREIEAIGIGRSWSVTLTSGDLAENINAGIASPGLFPALGIRAEAGRLIGDADMLGRPGNVALITHEMWQTRFGGARDVLGRTLTLDGEPVTVVGIIQPGVHVPLFEDVQLWRPLHIDPRDERHREWRGFVAYGRLREGASLRSARAELASLTAELRTARFATTPRWDITAKPALDLIVGNVRGPLLIFSGAVVLVLLIACANVANLVLARGAAREQEIAVRAALGASRARLVRTLLSESLLLSLAGAAFGILIAHWVARAFKALAPASIPRLDQVGSSGTLLVVAIGAGLLTALLFGLVPALRLSQAQLAQPLRQGGRSVTGRGRLGRLLVIAELAIALPLVTGAALLARSFDALTSWRPGFEREHLATFTLFLPSSAYPRWQDIGERWSRIEGEVASIPGVRSVSTASAGPLFGSRESWEMLVDDREDAKVSVRWYDVSPGFFETLGVPVVRGRPLGSEDRFGAPSSALVNETAANRLWPGGDPVGKRITFPVDKDRKSYTVVGVVRDVPPLRPDTRPEPEMYWSNRQQPRPFTYFLVRTDVPPGTIAEAVRARVAALDPNFVVYSFRTMPELMSRSLRTPRFNMTLLVAFGVTALLLAAIGTYGLLAYFVEQRTRDIGIRMALGASRHRVVLVIVGRGMMLALLGVVAGVVASLLLGRVIGAFLAGVSPRDPLILGSSAAMVLLVSAVACLVPAWRASRVDPVITLVAE